jgi:hypothetical protein
MSGDDERPSVLQILGWKARTAARRERFAAAALATLALCTACAEPSLRGCDSIRRQYIVRDGRVILDETARLLPDLDFDLQFKIYHCSARHMMPSLKDLAPTFAYQGQPAAEFLMQKMNGEPDDATILSTVELLEQMKILGAYDIGADAEAVALLHRRVFSIRDPAQRMLAQSSMSVIAHNPR